MSAFRKATKKAAKLRAGLIGPPGSGKTYTALRLCKALGGTTALIDTENHSSEKYADLFDFSVCGLEDSFHPRRYIEKIHEAEREGFDNLIIDSLSHAWIAKDGGLDLHDQAMARQKSKNSYTAWADVTPEHQALVMALVQCKCSLIVTLRSKVEYVQERDANGRTTVRKVGTAPLMRDGLEYEFDVVGDMEAESNTLVITKTRCPALKGKVFREPGEDLADILKSWLTDGISPGEELLRRLLAKEAELVRAGSCQPGALVEAVRVAGADFGPDITKWTREAYSLAGRVVNTFGKPTERAAVA